MPLYRSETREVGLAALPSPLVEALNRHAEKNQLVLDRVRCFLTHSVNPPSTSFFGKLLGRRSNPVDPDPEHDTAVVLHTTHLLIATLAPSRGATVLSLPLAQASIGRMSELVKKLGDVAAEPGMDITGFPGEHGRPGSYFVKLGEDPAGAACYAAVEAAIVAAKNP